MELNTRVTQVCIKFEFSKFSLSSGWKCFFFFSLFLSSYLQTLVPTLLNSIQPPRYSTSHLLSLFFSRMMVWTPKIRIYFKPTTLRHSISFIFLLFHFVFGCAEILEFWMKMSLNSFISVRLVLNLRHLSTSARVNCWLNLYNGCEPSCIQTTRTPWLET